VCEYTSTAYNYQPQIPERSRFNPLVPLEVAPGLIEAFSRYIGRLAAAHDVRVADLICHSLFDPLFPVGLHLRDRRRRFLANCHLLDGTHAYTPRWVSVMQDATCQRNLELTSLLPYADICDISWLRRTRIWCPLCLKSCAYEPLLWSIRVVTACPIHRVRLAARCPHCGRTNLPLAAYYAPGECAWCRGSLAGPGGVSDEMSAAEYELWVADEARNLIIRMKQLKAPLQSSCFKRALSHVVATMGASSQTALAAALGCTRRSLGLWVSGRALPRVQTLFSICFHVRIPVWKLLLAETDLADDGQDSRGRTVCEFPRLVMVNDPAVPVRTGVPLDPSADRSSASVMRRPRATHEDRQRLESILRTAIDAGVVDSPRRIAKAAGYTSPDRLLGQISRTATEMRMLLQRQREASLKAMEEALQSAIVTIPPPTLHQVALSLGAKSSRTLKRNVPRLCKQVVVKRRRWLSAQREHAADVLLAALRQGKLLSFKQFCKTQGLSSSHVTASFPEIKTKYQDEYRAQVQAERRETEVRFQSQTDVAVRSVLKRGRYPSVGRVTAENPSLKSRGWHHMRRAIDVTIKVIDDSLDREVGAEANSRESSVQSAAISN
jgi:DNA-binding XRE family transcriptional regulator